eukprot:scaffold221044_cov72-Attheya_sp.AAC.1
MLALVEDASKTPISDLFKIAVVSSTIHCDKFIEAKESLGTTHHDTIVVSWDYSTASGNIVGAIWVLAGEARRASAKHLHFVPLASTNGKSEQCSHHPDILGIMKVIELCRRSDKKACKDLLPLLQSGIQCYDHLGHYFLR